ncbi:MAG: hypothetical protein ACRD4P_06745 [Bryobacteraceae bacterium]
MKFAILAVFAALPSMAQAPAAPAAASNDGKQAQAPVDLVDQNPIRFDVTRVSLLFTVQDKKGRFITDLTKDEFQIV